MMGVHAFPDLRKSAELWVSKSCSPLGRVLTNKPKFLVARADQDIAVWGQGANLAR